MKQRLLSIFICLIFSANTYANNIDSAAFAFSNQEYKKAEKMLKPLAKQGDAHAQYLLATIYLDGLTGLFDTDKAVYYFKQAINGKHRMAAITLGRLYLSGMGVALDINKGSQLLELAETFPSEVEDEEECD